MATYQQGFHVNFPAAGALAEGTIVKLNSSGLVVAAAASTDPIIGVLAAATTVANETADVVPRNASGTYKVIAGGNIAINDLITTNASGQAITTTTSGDQVVGRATEAASAGQLFRYLVSDSKI